MMEVGVHTTYTKKHLQHVLEVLLYCMDCIDHEIQETSKTRREKS
jgi:hypothetical protein